MKQVTIYEALTILIALNRSESAEDLLCTVSRYRDSGEITDEQLDDLTEKINERYSTDVGGITLRDALEGLVRNNYSESPEALREVVQRYMDEGEIDGVEYEELLEIIEDRFGIGALG